MDSSAHSLHIVIHGTQVRPDKGRQVVLLNLNKMIADHCTLKRLRHAEVLESNVQPRLFQVSRHWVSSEDSPWIVEGLGCTTCSPQPRWQKLCLPSEFVWTLQFLLGHPFQTHTLNNKIANNTHKWSLNNKPKVYFIAENKDLSTWLNICFTNLVMVSKRPGP